MSAINFSDRVRLEVRESLDAPVTKPHCARCGMSNGLHAVGTEWICERCDVESKAPYYDTERGELCIPSDSKDASEWDRRGLILDSGRGVWWIAISPASAVSQVEKARACAQQIGAR
jgi:hypothetical protein